MTTQELLDELFNRAIDNVDLLDNEDLNAFLQVMKIVQRLDEEHLINLVEARGLA